MGKNSKKSTKTDAAPVVTPVKPLDLSAFKKKAAAPAKPLSAVAASIVPAVIDQAAVETPVESLFTLSEDERRAIIMKKVEAAKLAKLLEETMETAEVAEVAANPETSMVHTSTDYTTIEKAAFDAFDRTKPDYFMPGKPVFGHSTDKSFSKNHAGGGAKGKEGNTDHTAGKCQFARPCTVGWKSQNQPLQRGGGGRTPRMKSPAVAK
jgi:hypothetical protein